MVGDLTLFKTNAVNYYGVFCAEFDKFNPYTDVLTNARKKFYETHSRQKDKLIKRIDGEQYRFQYSLDDDHPLKWKVFTDTHILEKTVVFPDESYYVEVKDKNGVLQKRIYFNCFHVWVKTQYFNKGDTDPAVELESRDFSYVSVILRYRRDVQKPDVLYPCIPPSDKEQYNKVIEQLGTPDVASICSKGFVYYGEKEFSRQWNILCDKLKHGTVESKSPAEQVNTAEKRSTAAQRTDKKAPVKTAEQLPKKKRIDLTQTQETIIPNAHRADNSVVPPTLHTPDASNIVSGAKNPDLIDKINRAKPSGESFNISPRPMNKNLDDEPIFDDDDIGENISPSAPKLHSDVLLNYTDDVTEPVKGGKIPSINLDIDDDSKSVLDVKNDEDSSDTAVDDDLDENTGDNDSEESINIRNGDLDKTVVFDAQKQAAREENIARRAKDNTIEDVKRAYSMKKVQSATDAPKRTVAVDKVIKVSEDEQYYYFGDLENNRRNGRGRTIMENGCTAYDGSYINDKRDGFGVYYYKTGKICYAGNWRENRRNGLGIAFTPSDHSLYAGNWVNDCPVGTGAKFDGKGNLVFTSRWESGTREGGGVTYDPVDGSIFVGHWEDDVLSETGTKFDSEGNLLYNGHFKKSKRSGFGTSYNKKGMPIYSGEWKDDNYNGKGTLYLTHGFKIEGDFSNGMVCGFAVATHKNGSKLYEGYWAENRYNGQGKLYMSDGTWCQGLFEKGEPCGTLSGFSKDGNLMYKGEWSGGKFHGKGICYDNGEKIYEGELNNGIRSGSGHEYSDGKCVYVGHFKDNVRSGFGTSYDEDGNIEYSGMWQNGVYDGCGLLYVSGEPRYAGQFDSGSLHGRVNEIFDGIVVKECVYSEGECVYMREYTDDGLTLRYDGNVRGGSYEGMGCSFSPYGEKSFEGIFKRNEPFKSMKVNLRRLSKLEYCDEVSQSQYNKYINGPGYVVEKPYGGGTYSGLLVNGKPEGKGTMLYDDHGYTGSFSDGIACGLGVIYEWDGSEITGTFVKEAGDNTTEITLSNGITYHLQN